MLAAVIIIAAAGYTIYSFVQNNYDIKCNIVVVDGKITGYDTYSDDITKISPDILVLTEKRTC